METAATTELSLNLQVQEQDLRQSRVNKELKQSQRSSQICANAREEEKKTLCFVQSEDTFRTHPLRKWNNCCIDSRCTKRKRSKVVFSTKSIFTGILITSVYFSCNLQLYSCFSTGRITALLSAGGSLYISAVCLAQNQTSMNRGLRCRKQCL